MPHISLRSPSSGVYDTWAAVSDRCSEIAKSYVIRLSGTVPVRGRYGLISTIAIRRMLGAMRTGMILPP